MTEEVEAEEGEEGLGEIEMYEPLLGELLPDGGLIFDVIEFAELTNSIAAQMRDGQIFVLDRDSRQWRSVEPEKPIRGGKLSAVKRE